MTQKELPLAFKRYCDIHGIPLDHEDDWSPWYSCWNNGFNNGHVSGQELILNSFDEL